MRALRDLLATWENWTAQEANRRALAAATTHRQREVMCDVLERGDDVDALDALRDAAELVSLLTGWRWQVAQAARKAGANWGEIGLAYGVEEWEAEAEYVAAIQRQLHYGAKNCSHTGEVGG